MSGRRLRCSRGVRAQSGSHAAITRLAWRSAVARPLRSYQRVDQWPPRTGRHDGQHGPPRSGAVPRTTARRRQSVARRPPPRPAHRHRSAHTARIAPRVRRRGQESHQQYGASRSPEELLSGAHRVEDDHGAVTPDVTNFKKDARRVRADHHGEPVTQIPEPDGVAIGVDDVDFGQRRASEPMGRGSAHPSLFKGNLRAFERQHLLARVRPAAIMAEPRRAGTCIRHGFVPGSHGLAQTFPMSANARKNGCRQDSQAAS